MINNLKIVQIILLYKLFEMHLGINFEIFKVNLVILNFGCTTLEYITQLRS